MKSQLFSVVFMVVLSQGLGQYIIDGDCPTNRPVVQNFDVQKYTGKWYELARYDVFFERGCDCGWADYSLNEDGSVKVVNNCERLPSTVVSNARGQAVLSFPNASPIEGKLNVTIGAAPKMGSNYWILDTDYNHFSIVYHCTQIGNKAVHVAWILSKDRALDDSVKQKVDNYIDTYFERDQFRWSQLDPKICHPDGEAN